MHNPFIIGSCVEPPAFLNRKREIRRIVSGLLSGGQSAALVGEPRSGKTSLLTYLSAPETRADLYGERAAGLLFTYLDGQTLSGRLDPPRFWERALAPLEAACKEDSALQAAYRTCRQENFGTFVLERLFSQMKARGWRLVLLVDEFDAILHHPALNQAEFYGGLRSLVSRYDSLALVIAVRQPLADLNRATQEFSRTGSPYFNFMQEIPLGAFERKDALLLLERGAPPFTAGDKDYLLRLAGGHPYLLQAAASALWSAYQDFPDDPQERFAQTARDLLDQARVTLLDTWRLWTPEMKKAFVLVALDNLPALLGERRFDLNALLGCLSDYLPELRALEARGYLLPGRVGQTQSGYLLQAEVMLWWLGEELVQALRRKDDLGAWLAAENLDGLLKPKERAALVKAVGTVGGWLKNGAETFIKVAAEGAARALTGGA